MAVYLTILTPTILFAVLLLIEQMKQHKLSDAILTVVMVASTVFCTISTSNIIVGGSPFFAYSRIVNLLLATLILPCTYLLGCASVNIRYSFKESTKFFSPIILMILAAALMPFGTSGSERIMEFGLALQGVSVIIKTAYDYSHIDDADHRTDTVNTLMIRYGHFGLSFMIISLVGTENWMQHQEFAIVAFCFNTYCVISILHLTKKSYTEHQYMFDEVNELGLSTDEEAFLEEDGTEEIEEKKPNPPIDFAVSPEIPREENIETEQDNQGNGADMLASITKEQKKDELAIKLRTLIEKDKIYLRAGIRIDEVALILGTNRTYLAKKMKEVYGHTFAEYMNMCRLSSARADMLQRTNTSIETIALANGFNSSNTFNKVFNQFYGISPAAWRKQNA